MKAKELVENLITQITVYDQHETREIVFWLLEHYLKLSKIDILSNKEIPENTLNWQEIIHRLNTNEPIQYILGETEFYGRKFLVNSSVLIPRPETEELIELVLSNLELVSRNQQPANILDIGTGSGCIAISLAKEIPNAVVFAYDILEKALEIARKNAVLNNANVTFEKQDILNQPKANSQKLTANKEFDIIVSNPPYVTKSEMAEMRKNVLDFEPHLALFVENYEPLLFYKAIANFAEKSLISKGFLFLEINENYGKETAKLFENNIFESVEIIKDIHGKDRMIKAIKQ